MVSPTLSGVETYGMVFTGWTVPCWCAHVHFLVGGVVFRLFPCSLDVAIMVHETVDQVVMYFICCDMIYDVMSLFYFFKTLR